MESCDFLHGIIVIWKVGLFFFFVEGEQCKVRGLFFVVDTYIFMRYQDRDSKIIFLEF